LTIDSQCQRMLSYKTTPLIELTTTLSQERGLRLLVKREDLNHPFVSGNKWWKLKYNLEEAVRIGHDTLLTFGGAYSNHIFATAAAGKELGLKTIGIIRGEETLPLNHTLAFAENCGMKLHYVSREVYRKKTEPTFIQQLQKQFGNFYLIPEGGTNELAVKGCIEWAQQFNEIEFNYLCLPVGTGGTMAGMVAGIAPSKKIIGFSSLKGGIFLEKEIRNLTSSKNYNGVVNADYHFGGYGKMTSELKNFIQEMQTSHQLPLDMVYMGKMIFGIFDLVRNNYFRRDSMVLILHTGGLQNEY
jgi:1-aminocyclopropane-1-carboxylate deaminase